jgi:FAD:protein FMN transferase
MTGVFPQKTLGLMTLVVRSYFKFSLIILLFAFSCSQEKKDYLVVNGFAQGTTYSIKYSSINKENFSDSFDSILNLIDNELSIYDSSSFISLINNSSDTCFLFSDYPMFHDCVAKSKELYELSEKSFNPALYPLINYWGFYKSHPLSFIPDSLAIDSLLVLCQFEDCFTLLDTTICKTKSFSKLDFNAIAQGYSVDLIADFLDQKNSINYLIEIGGELSAKGVNKRGDIWKVGIDKPVEGSMPGENDFQEIISLENKSLATSGNYRKFYEINGQKYAHTIDPFTGYPVSHSLLSATVVAEEAYFADAMATSFMVKGLSETKDFILKNENLNLSVLLVYDSLGEYKEWKNF